MALVELDIESSELRAAVQTHLEHAGHVVGGNGAAVIVTDDALRAMDHLKRAATIVLSDSSQIRAAVATMRAGAFGYVFVPLQPGELELKVERAALGLLPPQHRDPLPLGEIEARYIRAVVDRFRGNQTKAAKALGIGRNTLWRKLKQYEDTRSSEQ